MLSRSTVRFLTADPLFDISVNNSFSLKKKWNKVHDSHPIIFLILHISANFHQNRTINKDFFLPVRSPWSLRIIWPSLLPKIQMKTFWNHFYIHLNKNIPSEEIVRRSRNEKSWTEHQQNVCHIRSIWPVWCKKYASLPVIVICRWNYST